VSWLDAGFVEQGATDRFLPSAARRGPPRPAGFGALPGANHGDGWPAGRRKRRPGGTSLPG